jgi:hypothetical protein
MALTGSQVPLPIDPPRIGGGSDSDTFWVGGSNIPKERRIRPKTLNARRPTDFKSASSVERFCTTGLPEDRKLALDESKGGISFTTWVSTTRAYIEQCGMDTVFRVYDPIKKTESYLLEDWGATSESKIFTWVTALKSGILNADGTSVPVCTFDEDNLAWSGSAILASIKIELWEAIEKDLGYDASGPEVFNAIVRKQQQVNSSSVRALVVTLSKMRLNDEPGQDVESFGNKVIEMSRRIEGTGSAPSDLSVLVATTFLNSEVLTFQLKASALHDKTDDDPSSVTPDEIVRVLKQKYRSLLSQGLWTPADGKQKDLEAEVAGLKAALYKLVQTGKQGKNEGNGNNEGRPGRDLSKVTCYNCQKLGHLAPDCPERKKNGSNGAGTQSTGGNGRPGTTNWRYVRPETGEPETKEVDGATWSYCSRCGRWTTGDKIHTTEGHKTREELQAAGNPQGNAAATGESENGGLQMMGNLMGSLFLCEDALRENDESDDKTSRGNSKPTSAPARRTGHYTQESTEEEEAYFEAYPGFVRQSASDFAPDLLILDVEENSTEEFFDTRQELEPRALDSECTRTGTADPADLNSPNTDYGHLNCHAGQV